jgi:hypothetical protein
MSGEQEKGQEQQEQSKKKMKEDSGPPKYKNRYTIGVAKTNDLCCYMDVDEAKIYEDARMLNKSV